MAEPRTVASGAAPILVATVVAGIAGYAIQAVVPIFVSEPSGYLRFAVFWSTLYFVVAALSGIQQELSRASVPVPAGAPPERTARSFTIGAVVGAAVTVLATSPAWSDHLFVTNSWALVGALAVGVASYTWVAAFSGILYGLGLWRAIAMTTIIDACLRLTLVVAVSFVQPSTTLLAWAVVLPFPLTGLVMWQVMRSRVVGRYTLDVRTTRLVRNSAVTVLAAIGTGAMTSGLPMIIGATAMADAPDDVGRLVFVITLTRAPVVTVLIALQSFLTVRFREHLLGIRTAVMRLQVLLLGATLLVGAAAYLFEPAILAAVWGPSYAASALVCALVAITAGLTGGMVISGAALLAQNRHTLVLAGWMLSALVLTGVLLLPLGFEARVMLALAAGPAAGLAFHLTALVRPPAPSTEAAV